MDSVNTDLDELARLKWVLEQAKTLHIPKREMTFFDTALRKHYENPTTELLAFFLNPENEHGLQGVFYQGLLAALAAQNQALAAQIERLGEINQVYTEVVTEQGSRIDLLLETDNGVVVGECKIGHHQNNPFADYEACAAKMLVGKEITECIKLVLCVDGKSYAAGWNGLSYRALARHIKPVLAEALLNQPYNKWALLAREFLMHWEQLGVDVMNQEQMDFVVGHLGDIKKMMTMRDDFYCHVRDCINEALESQLEGYQVHYRQHSWSTGPALRFANNNCPHWTEVVVNLHIDEQPLKYTVRVYIDEQTDKLVNLACKELRKLSWEVEVGNNTWTEQNGRYWVGSWEGKFELADVIKEVVELMQVLMKVEASR